MTVSRRYIDSSSFKMALLFTVLLALAAAILGYFLVDFGKREFLRETEAAIDIEINMLSTIESTDSDLRRYIDQRTKSDPFVRFRYEGESGEIIAGTIDSLPEQISKMTEGVLRFDLDTNEGTRSFAAKIHTFDDGSRIIIARNIHNLIAGYDRIVKLSWLILLLMFVVVIVSFGISYFVVSRINRISAIAQRIVETGDLSQRLAIDSRWDDLSNLSHILNGFLEKIENLMSGVREVTNNIAHDLRTPLSSLRNDIESLRGNPVDDSKIDSLLADADRILTIFQALLRIANIERGNRSQHLADIEVNKIIKDIAELYEPVAEEKNIKLNVKADGNLTITGDGDLLFQLFANLTDNAIKFAPGGSTILLSADRNIGGRVIASVEDQGPGIPDHEKENVFKHFYRGDASRSTPGNGLGLSLVRAVAERHRAKITLEDRNPGLRIKIAF